MEKDSAAWMLCDEILTKAKDEFVLEAIDILHQEIKAKRVDIKGFLPLLPEKPKELERDLFIINNIVAKSEDVREQYKDYMNGNLPINKSDPKSVQRVEDLGKFLNSVNAITMLMTMSQIFKSWSEEAGKYATVKDPVEIVLKTLIGNAQRVDALKFAVSSMTFRKNEALSADEMDILVDALGKITQTPHRAG